MQARRPLSCGRTHRIGELLSEVEAEVAYQRDPRPGIGRGLWPGIIAIAIVVFVMMLFLAPSESPNSPSKSETVPSTTEVPRKN
jgi:hypothetical protein